MTRIDDGEFKVFTLHIEGVNIDHISLEDIGQYLTDLSELLGKDASPRYHAIKRGSLTIAAKVPREREIDVKTRGFLLRTGDAPEEAVRARQRIAKRLGMHHAKKATLLDATRDKIIDIPIERPIPVVDTPPLLRAGSLQGKVIRLGGKQDIVPVEIQDVDGHIYLCRASRELARRLAREMFDQTIRAHGSGKWIRSGDGVWYVQDFMISSFEILDSDCLADVVNQLRGIPGAWVEQDDSFERLEGIRRGEI